jgi:regulator of protease activity HflC (stomatin/prohibitin superfamily)
MELLIPAGLAILLALLVVRTQVRSLTVYEFEQALKYRRGRFIGLVGPGRYWHRPAVTRFHKVDGRAAFVSITGQEVLSSDGVTLKVSLAARYRVADPAIAINEVQDYSASLYLELQLALRKIIGGTPIDELLETRQEIGERLLAETASKAGELGIELLDVEVKDVMFPGALKKIFSQVVQARQEGLAALERARGETAALRNLANAAQLVERNPNIMQLRLLQMLGQTQGNTVVLGLNPQSGPYPITARELAAGEEEPPEGEG